jgi:hypothetical protein
VVKASKSVVCVFVDCAWGAKYTELAKRYSVKGFPTVVYADSEGEEVGRMEDRSAEAMTRALTKLAKEHGPSYR